MTDPFHSSKHSIAWAKDHLAKFEREMDAFFQPDAYTTVTDLNDDGTYKLLKFKLTNPMPLARNGHVIDAINNLRSALDQAICSVATLAGIRADNTFFPIANSAADESALNGRCGKLPKEISDLVRTFKPYKGGNDLLWALNKLSNTNKHGLIRPVAMANYSTAVKGQSKGDVRLPYPPRWDSTKNEMVLVEAAVDAEYTVNYDYSFFIAFSDIEFVDGEPVLRVLDYLAGVVESIVMAIEAETKRIGLL